MEVSLENIECASKLKKAGFFILENPTVCSKAGKLALSVAHPIQMGPAMNLQGFRYPVVETRPITIWATERVYGLDFCLEPHLCREGLARVVKDKNNLLKPESCKTVNTAIAGLGIRFSYIFENGTVFASYMDLDSRAHFETHQTVDVEEFKYPIIAGMESGIVRPLPMTELEVLITSAQNIATFVKDNNL